MAESMICPVCFRRYSAMTIPKEYPLCPDCDSEAIGVEVVPLGDFLNETSLAQLEEISADWSASQEFLPDYKQTKQRRIDDLIARKRKLVDR